MENEYIRMMDVTIPYSLYQELLVTALDPGSHKEIGELATIAISEWVRRGYAKTIFSKAKTGYQWKDLFLPHGTALRTSYGDKNFHAFVERDKITMDGQTLSPNQFVNLVGGVRRNARKMIWVLFPNESIWRRAEKLLVKAPRRKK